MKETESTSSFPSSSSFSSSSSLMTASFVGGLAGSSCCLLQVILNVLSTIPQASLLGRIFRSLGGGCGGGGGGGGIFESGCAGFNTLLGPIRPYVRILTFVYFANRWGQYYHYASPAKQGDDDDGGSGGSGGGGSATSNGRNQNEKDKDDDDDDRKGEESTEIATTHNGSSSSASSPPRSTCGCSFAQLLSATILCTILTFLPEILQATNLHRHIYFSSSSSSSSMRSSSSSFHSSFHSSSSENLPDGNDGDGNGNGRNSNISKVERRTYAVDNMGCEACESYVRQIVEGTPGVVSLESITYQTGELIVFVRIPKEVEEKNEDDGDDETKSAAGEQKQQRTVVDGEDDDDDDDGWDEKRLDERLEAMGYDLLPGGSITKQMKFHHRFGGGDTSTTRWTITTPCRSNSN